MSSITTRKGDDGTTGLLYGQRVSKAHPQIHLVGLIDELNVAIGEAKFRAGNDSRSALLALIQGDLVNLMGELACAQTDRARYMESKFRKLGPESLTGLDSAIDALEAKLGSFHDWVMPGANEPSLAYEKARVAARRAERELCDTVVDHRPLILQYVNRLSDLLWLLAREAQ